MNFDEHWLILDGNEEEVRELSMLLDVTYKSSLIAISLIQAVSLLDTREALAAQ
jgi:hypothetical protein